MESRPLDYDPQQLGPCIIPTKKPSDTGYVIIQLPTGEWRGAHRLAWIAANGPIPDGMHVCHKCDVRNCVNVDHLFLGTRIDNMRDMTAKGRGFNQRKTECPKGHPYDGVGHRGDGSQFRVCSICYEDNRRARRARARAEGRRVT